MALYKYLYYYYYIVVSFRQVDVLKLHITILFYYNYSTAGSCGLK